MIRKPLVMLLLALCISAYGQQIAKYEYWFDSDIGTKVTGTPQGNTIDLTLDIKDMHNGVHTLNFRAADDRSRWSAPMATYFVKVRTGNDRNSITEIEYWTDGNTATKTTAATEGTVALDIDVSGMAEGVHSIGYRLKDSHGAWSAPMETLFVKVRQGSTANRITTIEYWTDGNTATKTTAATEGTVTLDVDVSSMTEGVHSIGYRMKDFYGAWSAPREQYFIKTATGQTTTAVTCYEYWTDSDTDTKTTVKATGGVLMLDLDVAGMAQGVHTLTLRAQDTHGRWSAPTTQYFVKPVAAFGDGRIMGYQYWFNDAADKATYVKLDEPVAPLLLDVQLPVNSTETEVRPDNIALVKTESGKYQIGTRNRLHIRFKNTDRYWSDIQTDTFTTVVDGAQLDLTQFIANPDASDGVKGWTVTGNASTLSESHWSGTENPYFIIGNKYSAGWTATMEQTISGLPAGTYCLTAAGRAAEGTVLEISAAGYSVTFPATGAEGGEIWEDADEGSAEKEAGNGKGAGWSRRSLVFTTNGDPVVLQVKGTAETSGLWADIDDMTLELNSTTALDVTFADGVDMNRYKDLRLVLRSAQSAQTLTTAAGKRTYSFRGLSSNAEYSLSLQNRHGQEFTRKADISLEEGDNSLTLDSVAAMAEMRMTVKDSTGTDVTGATKVTWTTQDGTYMADGSMLTGIPAGCEMAYSVTLNDSLGTVYHEEEELKVTAEAGVNNLTMSLRPIESLTVSGRVMTEDGPATGAAVSAVQLLNGRYRSTNVATAGTDGGFSMTLMNDSTVLTASMDGYVNATAGHHDFGTTTDAGTLTLKPIKGNVVDVSYKYIRCAGGNGEAADWFDDYANVDYSVTNKTTGRTVENLTVQKTTLILPPESTSPGDMIEVTARSKNGTFADAEATATIAPEDSTTKLTMEITELGGMAAEYTASANERNVALLYDSNGRLAARTAYTGSKAEISHQAAGSYYLVSMGESGMLASIQSLADIEATGMMEGRDYTACDVTIDNGVTTAVTVTSIPKLDETAFYYTTQNTLFMTNKSTVVTGNFVTLTAKIDLKEKYANVADGMSLTIDLPDGCAYVENSAIIGTEAAPHVMDGNRLVISLTKENYRERIRFCLMPTQSGLYAPTAMLHMNIEEEEVAQPIGTATFTADDMGISVPSTTSKKQITASGTAQPYAEVTVYDDNVMIGSTQAKADGSWMAQCELYRPYNLTLHPIHAEILTQSLVKVKTETKTVEYNMSHNEVKSVTMINTAHTAANLNLYEYRTVFDFQNPSDESPVYWYWPSYPTFTFVVDFKDNNPDIVTEVNVLVKTTIGDYVEFPAVYDKQKNCWIATHDFHQGNLPINVGVAFNCLDEYLIDYSEIEDVNAEIEQLKEVINTSIEEIERIHEEIDVIRNNPNHTDEELDKKLKEFGNPEIKQDENHAKDISKMSNEELAKHLENEKSAINTLIDEAEQLYNKAVEDFNNHSKYETSERDVEGHKITRTTQEYSGTDNLEDYGYQKKATTTGNFIYEKCNEREYSIVDPKQRLQITYKSDNNISDIVFGTSNFLSTYIPSADVLIDATNNYFYAFNKDIQQYLNRLTERRALFGNYENELKIRIRKEDNEYWRNIWESYYKWAKDKRIQTEGVYCKVSKVPNKIMKTLDSFDKYSNVFDLVNGASIVYDYTKLRSIINALEVPDCAYETSPDAAKLLDTYVNEFKNEVNTHFGWKVGRECVYKIGDFYFKKVPVIGYGMGMYEGYVEDCSDRTFKLGLNDRIGMYQKSVISMIEKCNIDDETKERLIRKVLSGCADAKFVMDPSGYVYEAVTSNRLEGVTVTVYQKEKKEDMYGDEYEEITKWNAEAYQQKNPLITDKNGYYAWDVPQGLWQVKYEKDGYETVYSEWLPVPPPQLDINVGMSHAVAPEVRQMRGFESGITVEMSKYMRPQSFTEGSITVLRNGMEEKGSIKMVNAEKDPYEDREFVSKVKFVPERSFNLTDNVVVTVHKGVESYCGMKMAEDYTQTVVIEPEIRAIEVDSVTDVIYGNKGEIVVSVIPAEAANGKTLYVNSSSQTIASTNNTETVIGKDGKAVITINGNLPGCAALVFSMTETDITAEMKVNVAMAPTQAAMPKASIESGTVVEPGTKVTLSTTTENATIYYTTDGSCPCDESSRMLYDKPIEINDNVTIKAVAVKDGYEDSDIATFVYFIESSGVNNVNVDGRHKVSVNNGRLTIEDAEGCSLKIYNTGGELVMSDNRLTDNTVIKGLRLGNTYIVSITDKQGNTAVMKVLIN